MKIDFYDFCNDRLLNISWEDERLIIEIQFGMKKESHVLNRKEANLLMLFLQEHLGQSEYKKQVSDELDKAIAEELKDKPKDIMK